MNSIGQQNRGNKGKEEEAKLSKKVCNIMIGLNLGYISFQIDKVAACKSIKIDHIDPSQIEKCKSINHPKDPYLVSTSRTSKVLNRLDQVKSEVRQTKDSILLNTTQAIKR